MLTLTDLMIATWACSHASRRHAHLTTAGYPCCAPALPVRAPLPPVDALDRCPVRERYLHGPRPVLRPVHVRRRRLILPRLCRVSRWEQISSSLYMCIFTRLAGVIRSTPVACLLVRACNPRTLVKLYNEPVHGTKRPSHSNPGVQHTTVASSDVLGSQESQGDAGALRHGWL